MSEMDPSVKEVFDILPKEYSVLVIVKCGDKKAKYFVKPTGPNQLVVNDSEMTFDKTKLQITLKASKNQVRVQRRNAPIELAIHTLHGKAYVSSADGQVYKSYAEGNVKVAKASKGDISVTSGSSVCVVL